MPIIKSLLDTDLYKFSMGQIALHRFPTAHVRYEFRCRNKEVDLRPYADEIREELFAWTRLRLTPIELKFLSSIRWFKPGYINFLTGYRPDINDLHIDATGDALKIEVAGNWAQTIYWEVPLLAIVNEVYFRHNADAHMTEGRRNLQAKIHWLKLKLEAEPEVAKNFSFTEFGTRRRLSRDWQEEVVSYLQQSLGNRVMLGTSNVNLAHNLVIKPFGTMAHEYQQVCQAYAPLPHFLEYSLEQWAQEYRGDLGYALSDVVGMDAFLKAFDLYFCKLFDGARHDSGDPSVWCQKLIDHYKVNRIDPKTKTAVFSDGLDFEKAWNLTREFGDQIQVMHGIGTWLTNDVGLVPLNIVMKVVECNGQPVAKISDSPGKGMCRDQDYLNYLASLYGLQKQLGQDRVRAMIEADPEGYANYLASR